MILMSKTQNGLQLMAIYSAVNVLFNPTVEDNYPTVNLEAEACGTSVVTYDTGGCRETVVRYPLSSYVVDGYEPALRVLFLLMTGTVNYGQC